MESSCSSLLLLDIAVTPDWPSFPSCLRELSCILSNSILVEFPRSSSGVEKLRLVYACACWLSSSPCRSELLAGEIVSYGVSLVVLTPISTTLTLAIRSQRGKHTNSSSNKTFRK
jgi:hypothetical protein